MYHVSSLMYVNVNVITCCCCCCCCCCKLSLRYFFSETIGNDFTSWTILNVGDVIGWSVVSLLAVDVKHVLYSPLNCDRRITWRFRLSTSYYNISLRSRVRVENIVLKPEFNTFTFNSVVCDSRVTSPYVASTAGLCNNLSNLLQWNWLK